uniref:Uncharacterized protein LOC114333042 isoform X1 n=1 Tax=Diabrotica virgifera virgifera TaxID=50390 RepID=A0A6P7FV57_DIAVI
MVHKCTSRCMFRMVYLSPSFTFSLFVYIDAVSLVPSPDSKIIKEGVAIHFAEKGLNVWFISPSLLDNIPANIVPPDKEILQLITFIYLKDCKDLLNHLNTIHLWHKSPTVILICGFDIYTNIFEENYKPMLAALLSTTLLDSSVVCYKKNKKSTYLILTLQTIPDNYRDRIKVLYDMYFPNIITDQHEEIVIDKVVNYYINK